MAKATATEPAPPNSLAYKHFSEFLDAINDPHHNDAEKSNKIYSDYADTPTRRRKLILSNKNKTLDSLSTLSQGGTNSILHDKSGSVLDAKLVAFVVDLLCEQSCTGTATNRHHQHQDGMEQTDHTYGDSHVHGHGHDHGNEPMERLDSLLDLFNVHKDDSNGSQRLWRNKMELAFMLPDKITEETLCQLPSLFLSKMNHSEMNQEKHQKKRRKYPISSYNPFRVNVQKIFAMLGYLLTHLLVHEVEGVVTFSLLKDHLMEQIVKNGLVGSSLHSLDYDAFMVGFAAFFLDLMEVSTGTMENILDSEDKDNELETDGISRDCIVRDDLTVEGLDVAAVVDCLSGNT